MLLTSLALAGLAVALAWPVPIALAASAWPSRAPVTALIVWQAVALAGGLSMIGALLCYGLQPFGDDLVGALVEFARRLGAGTLPSSADFVHMFALSSAVLLGIHLLLNLVLAFVRDERSRRRHRRLVQLLSSPLPDQPGTRLLDHEAPVAYCLPGSTRSITVLSAGLISILDEEQLRAVIAHEQAHAMQRHHLVLLAFRAWRRSLPWFPIATKAQDAVAVLVEMLADDRARRAVGDSVLATAIAVVAIGAPAKSAHLVAPDGDGAGVVDHGEALAASGPAAMGRISRLITPANPLSSAAKVFAVLCALSLLAVPTALLLLPLLSCQR
ncbi:peptidase M48-like protein [Homoserinimonas aerilata]|uniref:Peptidase M48-like protein n=1 Tax=Homoserinimonas aerilata TaxID=1162970 RepID=A0A542YIW3_9MICO|nr:M56 family metallopeptidase [Homoserinimonas aerilata]TQL48012.1 peptidase M48-like protein [Homoserinimonas aerilata]